MIHLRKLFSTFLTSWFGSLVISILIATSFKSAIADWYVVPTGSMLPTIVEGDRILVNKLAYDLKIPFTTIPVSSWGDPQRGDIVVFYSPAEPKRLVKRVIGLPGDTIAMHNNRLLINKQPVDLTFLHHGSDEPWLRDTADSQEIFTELLPDHPHKTMTTPEIPARRSFPPVTIPPGQYLMLGDNRDNSADSRYFGFVPRREILGKATKVVISLDLDDHYRPRWQRFFSNLL